MSPHRLDTRTARRRTGAVLTLALACWACSSGPSPATRDVEGVGRVSFEIPAGWTERPPSANAAPGRIELMGGDGQLLDVTVEALPGDLGDLNVGQWSRQALQSRCAGTPGIGGAGVTPLPSSSLNGFYCPPEVAADMQSFAAVPGTMVLDDTAAVEFEYKPEGATSDRFDDVVAFLGSFRLEPGAERP